MFVPPTRCRPRSPAGCCPPTVPHADAAANAGRAALLVAALAGQPELLLARHRRLPAPGLPRARRCRTRWPWSTRCAPTASPAVVSGAGPTVLAFTDAAGAAGRSLARCPAGWVGAPTWPVDRGRRPGRADVRG